MSFFQNNREYIALALATIGLIVGFFTASWWGALAVVGVFCIALSYPVLEYSTRWAVGLVIVGAMIEGFVFWNPVRENQPDPRWAELFTEIMQVDVGSVAYLVRDSKGDEDSSQLQERADKLEEKVRDACAQSVGANARNIVQDAIRARIPSEATLVTDWIDTKENANACIDFARELAGLVPQFKPAFDRIMDNKPF